MEETCPECKQVEIRITKVEVYCLSCGLVIDDKIIETDDRKYVDGKLKSSRGVGPKSSYLYPFVTYIRK